jgi:hypothetical protein
MSPLVDPENLNELKFLTSAPVMITLERWIFPSLFTTQDKVYDYATRRLGPSRFRLHLVSVVSRHAERTHRFAPSSRSL